MCFLKSDGGDVICWNLLEAMLLHYQLAGVERDTEREREILQVRLGQEGDIPIKYRRGTPGNHKQP